MESTSSRSVNDLPATERQVLEGLLGQPLSPDQRVFVMAYTPSALPEESVREAAMERLRRTFAKVDRYAAARGVTPEEAEAAVDEAMDHVRPRKG